MNRVGAAMRGTPGISTPTGVAPANRPVLAATETLPLRTDAAALRHALAFTELYRRVEGEPVPLREAACLAAQFPATLRAIEDGDRLAGRVGYAPVGFSPEPGGFGYYCDEAALRRALESLTAAPARGIGETNRLAAAVDDTLLFWRERTTARRTRAAYPADLAATLPSDDWCGEAGIAFPLYRLAGVCLDFGKLVRLGLDGLREEVAAARARGADPHWCEGMRRALEVVAECCRFYAAQARAQRACSRSPARAAELAAMAGALEGVAEAPPRTLHEALQLAWLYALVAGVLNYGRMDVVFGPFLAADVLAGRSTEEEALALLQSLWRLMAARRTIYNGRVVVGGRGRPDERTADRFARLALEATRAVVEVEPQLSFRFHAGSDPQLKELALDLIGSGRTYPMLYNDDVNVPAVQAAFGVARDEAEQYFPFGCGEYVLEHRSLGTPNGVVNLLKALESAIHERPWSSFDELETAYRTLVERHLAALAEHEALEYRVMAREASFLLPGLLYDDCVARGQPLLEGGARHLGGTVETYGNVNTADSLCAIRALVFEQRRIEPRRLREALAADFAGCQGERALLRAVPKYGNDDERPDAMAVRVHEHVCRAAQAQAARVGLDSYNVVIINNHANTVLGRFTGASADGRRAGEPMANGNNPSSGADRSGTTAFLRSLVKPDASLHAGAVQNMKFAREMFAGRRRETEALLDTYFALGGTQAMISVVSRGDLEAALSEPERWGQLMVRVGGFSARFVELSSAVQREILERTLN
jgi:pyruvate-formate lyase